MLFQLMVWAEENNFTEEYDPIYEELPDYNPFQEKPDSFKGTLEEWDEELDSFEKEIKKEYIEICENIWKKTGYSKE